VFFGDLAKKFYQKLSYKYIFYTFYSAAKIQLSTYHSKVDGTFTGGMS